MAAERPTFGSEQTRERLAILEVEVKHVVQTIDDLQESVGKLDDKVEGLCTAFHELRVELAKKRSTPPPAVGGLTATAQRSIGGIIGAALVYALQALLSGPHVAPEPNTGTAHTAPISGEP